MRKLLSSLATGGPSPPRCRPLYHMQKKANPALLCSRSSRHSRSVLTLVSQFSTAFLLAGDDRVVSFWALCVCVCFGAGAHYLYYLFCSHLFYSHRSFLPPRPAPPPCPLMSLRILTFDLSIKISQGCYLAKFLESSKNSRVKRAHLGSLLRTNFRALLVRLIPPPTRFGKPSL